MPRRPSARRRVATAAATSLLALAGLGACSDDRTPVVTDPLPPELALRSDTPYVMGTIVRREAGEAGSVRLHVRAPTDDPSWGGRRREAHVTAHPDSLLVRWDGRRAPLGSLAVGRIVLVWVRGPELRSEPPQVTGSAILLRD